MNDWSSWFEALDRAMPRGWSPDRQAQGAFARWAQPSEILAPGWLWKPGTANVLLGQYQDSLVCRNDDNRHLITVAGTRAGKGRSLILPNLITWPGSAIVIDPKGELARKTARWRNEGLKQSVVVLDPFGVSGWKGTSYNPLDDIDPASDSVMDDVAMIADALITNESTGDRHWTDSAKNLIRLLILYMFTDGGEATFLRLRRILLGDEGQLSGRDKDSGSPNLFTRMMETDGFDGYVKLVAANFYDKHDRELSSILSVTREQLSFLDSKRLPGVLEPSGFTIESINQQPTTVYMCLPASRLATHFRWLRVIVNLAMAKLESRGQVQPLPALLLLEEFATLGHMEAIEKAAGQIAGFGVKLWVVLQDLGQLKAIYKDRWETFLGNAGITTWFGLNDLTSLEYVSKRLWTTHFVRVDKTDLTSSQRQAGAAEFREVVVGSPLLTSEEVERMFARETTRLLVLHPGSRPVVLKRLDASDAMFNGMIDEEK